MYIVKSPILFLIFNRPEETLKVFNAIRTVKPSKLYIAADGPRLQVKTDLFKCQESQKIINLIDWDCEVKTLINEKNLGCKISVSNSISWFFKNEGEGIILEDDCLPCNDFFKFCDEMLSRYRYDNRIGHISGSNFQNGIKRGIADYYYSKLTNVWGWASWRRVWDNYDINMSSLDLFINEDVASVITIKKEVKKIINNNFLNTKKNLINTWDYQYFYSNLIHGFLSIIPNYNLVINIGFGEEATHTKDPSNFHSLKEFDNLPVQILHPKYFQSNMIADEYTFQSKPNNNIRRYLNKLFK